MRISLGFDQSLDGCGRLAHHVLALFRSLGHAMPDVIVEQADCNLLERIGRRGDLRQDVDAIDVVLDHLLQPSDLTFDALEPGEDVAFVAVIAPHNETPFVGPFDSYTLGGYGSQASDHGGIEGA